MQRDNISTVGDMHVILLQELRNFVKYSPGTGLKYTQKVLI